MTRGLEILLKAIENEYELLSDYNGNREPITIKCLNCGDIFESKPRYFKNESTGRTGKCKKCNQRSNSKKDVFMKYMKQQKDYQLLSSYVKANEKVDMQHLTCGHKYKVSPSYFMNRENRCPKCFRESKRKEQEFLDYVDTVDNYKVVSEYKSLHDDIELLHEVCGKSYITKPSKFKHQHRRCPNCHGSNGELSIQDFLDKYNIKYQREKKFDDLVYNEKLRMDFYVEHNGFKYCIEFHGRQHYEFIQWFHKTYQHFEERKTKDKLKKEYCTNNNIKYIEIPYSSFKDISTILQKELGITNSLNT